MMESYRYGPTTTASTSSPQPKTWIGLNGALSMELWQLGIGEEYGMLWISIAY